MEEPCEMTEEIEGLAEKANSYTFEEFCAAYGWSEQCELAREAYDRFAGMGKVLDK